MPLAPEYVGYIELEHEAVEECWSAPPNSYAAEANVVVVVADVPVLREELDREWLLLVHKARAMLKSSPSRKL